MYPPSKPATTLVSSSVDLASKEAIDCASLSKLSSTVDTFDESPIAKTLPRRAAISSDQKLPIFTFLVEVDCLKFNITFSRCSSLNRSPKYASR